MSRSEPAEGRRSEPAEGPRSEPPDDRPPDDRPPGEGRPQRLRPAALLRWWPAVVYPAVLGAASFAVLAEPAPSRAARLAWASTNLDNLAHHPVRVLFVSGFLADGDVLAWTVLAVVGLAGLVAAAGPLRAVLTAAAAHLAGTAVSEGALDIRITRGLEPVAVRTIVDVGPSFIVVGTLVATVVCGRTVWWRLAAAAGFALAAPGLFGGLPQWDVAAVGHVTSVAVGLAAGTWFSHERRRGSASQASLTAPRPQG